MRRSIIVLNVGSSSVRADLFTVGSAPADPVLCASIKKEEVTDFRTAIEESLDQLVAHGGLSGRERIDAVGHRVVHGGAELPSPVEIDEHVLDKLRATVRLAPLHNPAAIQAIEIARAAFPGIPHLAVFDTAFHATLPDHARRYAVSRRLHEELGVRRYGFHGTSHAFVARRAADILARPLEQLRLITLHLGNGASATAIRGGCSIDTSMGMTPLEGLVMGTRVGDLDPAVPMMLAREGWTTSEMEEELYQRAGLRGLAGDSDMREVSKRAREGAEDARLARAIYAYRIKKYIGAYLAILGGLDAIVFTGGIGENDAELRAMVCDGLQHLGILCDPTKNEGASGAARIESGAVAILVIPTDEELEIARQLRSKLDELS